MKVIIIIANVISINLTRLKEEQENIKPKNRQAQQDYRIVRAGVQK